MANCHGDNSCANACRYVQSCQTPPIPIYKNQIKLISTRRADHPCGAQHPNPPNSSIPTTMSATATTSPDQSSCHRIRGLSCYYRSWQDRRRRRSLWARTELQPRRRFRWPLRWLCSPSCNIGEEALEFRLHVYEHFPPLTDPCILNLDDFLLLSWFSLLGLCIAIAFIALLSSRRNHHCPSYIHLKFRTYTSWDCRSFE